MAAVQAKDLRASFLFVGDLNGYHQEQLGCTTTIRHCVTAFDFATVSGSVDCRPDPCTLKNTLDLLMTDVNDLVWVSFVAPTCNSDHASLSAIISMAQAVQNLCVSRKAFPKHQVNCNRVCDAIQDLPIRNIWFADNPVEVLNEHLLLLVGRFVSSTVIDVRNKDKPWYQYRHVF